MSHDVMRTEAAQKHALIFTSLKINDNIPYATGRPDVGVLMKQKRGLIFLCQRVLYV
jgi:hypothetical protein